VENSSSSKSSSHRGDREGDPDSGMEMWRRQVARDADFLAWARWLKIESGRRGLANSQTADLVSERRIHSRSLLYNELLVFILVGLVD
jgi:hypothetical protein